MDLAINIFQAVLAMMHLRLDRLFLQLCYSYQVKTEEVIAQ